MSACAESFTGPVEKRKADDRQGVFDGGHLLEHAFDLPRHFACARHGSTVRQLHRDEERSLILFRKETRRRDACHTDDTASENRDQKERHYRDADQPTHAGRVAVSDPVDALQCLALDAAPRPTVSQEDGAKRGGQGQRVQSGDEHGGADRHRELPEQGSGYPGNKCDRNKDGQQNESDRDDRRGDLRHCLLGRGGRREIGLGLHHAFDVLDNNDGIVHDDADCQHHRQQRDGIRRVTQQQ
jgi:hypothetical protein